MRVTLTLNGDRVEADVEPQLLLVGLLRDGLGLTGTKIGCDTGQCGSCVVLVDDRSVKSCAMLAVQADGAAVTTIEGVAGLDSLQQALWEQHGVQCGFCAPGVVLSLHDRLARPGVLTEAEVRDWLAGHLCRCTGYHGIVRAALSVANAGEGDGG